MRSPTLSILFLTSLLAAACDSSSDPDERDATTADRGVSDPDAGQRDATSPADLGPQPDGGMPSDSGAPTDSGSPGDSGGGLPDGAGRTVCNDPFTLDGVVSGPIGPMPRRFLPASPSPTTAARIEESGDFIAGDLAPVTAQDGVLWHAQVSHLTRFDQVRYEHMIVDPSDGALYVAIEQQLQSDSTAMRFYNADGSLAVELARDEVEGSDIVGRSRQSNFFLLKYAASGALAWVSRFGPNSASGDRAGVLPLIGLVPDGVRVAGYAEGSVSIVIAAGKTNSLSYQAPGAQVFWATLSKDDGSYVDGSIRRIDVDLASSASTITALSYSAHNASGSSALAGRLFRDSGTPTFTIGAGGPSSVVLTTTQSRALFLQIAADGTPAIVATVTGPTPNAAPEPRAVGIGPGGELVAGAQFSVLAGEAQFHDVSGTDVVTYEEQTSVLVAYEPSGERRWLKLLPNTHRNAVSRILVTSDAVYLMGTGAAGVVMGAGEPNETALPLSGYVLSKHSLATGELQWLRMLTDETGVSGIGGYDVWSSGSNLVVPMSFLSFRLAGVGIDRIYDSLNAGTGLLGALVLDPNGTPLSCQPVAEGGGTFRPL